METEKDLFRILQEKDKELKEEYKLKESIGEEVKPKIKVGYNAESPYSVLGIVTDSNVNIRKTSKGTSNLAPAIGYHLYDSETDSDIYVTKEQGIHFGIEVGFNNSYIRIQERTVKDELTNQTVKMIVSTYLHPMSRGYAFTSDENLVTAFELNHNGQIKMPVNTIIEKEKCTTELWRLIVLKQNTLAEKNFKRVVPTEDEREEILGKIKSTLTNKEFKNPFQMGIRGK